MKDTHTYGLWGAVAGAAAICLLGFTWGGWTTAGSAKQAADKAAENVYVGVCARDMLANPVSVALLKTKATRDYDDAVRDAWKPGYEVPEGFQFRQACGKAIEALMAKTAQKS